jgi:hypothetical protein
MEQELDNLIKMSKLVCSRIDDGLALGEKLDISPLREAIATAENIDFVHLEEILDICIAYINWTRANYNAPLLYMDLDLVDCLKKYKESL